MENPIKMDDLGVPLFSETPTSSSLPHLADLLDQVALSMVAPIVLNQLGLWDQRKGGPPIGVTWVAR